MISRLSAIMAVVVAFATCVAPSFGAPVGGPKIYRNVNIAGGNVVSRTFDLVGASTTVVVRTSGPSARVRVVGALTGLDYGTFRAVPGQPVFATISHLPFAKLTVYVQNEGVFSDLFDIEIK